MQHWYELVCSVMRCCVLCIATVFPQLMPRSIFSLIKTHDSESRGQEEAAVRDE